MYSANYSILSNSSVQIYLTLSFMPGHLIGSGAGSMNSMLSMYMVVLATKAMPPRRYAHPSFWRWALT